MTYRFFTNQLPLSRSDIIYQWKQFMTSASPTGPGWEVLASSDGLQNQSNTGDIFTTSGDGYFGLNNSLAWFVIQMPNTSRQFCFQRSNYMQNGDDYWRIKYSITGFTNAGTITQTPSAGPVGPSISDEVVLLGSGTNAVPGFNNLFSGSIQVDKFYRFNCVADDAPPYGMIWFSYPIAGLIPNGLERTSPSGLNSVFLIDPLSSGSYDAINEQDPYVFYVDGSTSSTSIIMPNLNFSTSSILAQAYIRRGLPGQVFVNKSNFTSGIVAGSYGFNYKPTTNLLAPSTNHICNALTKSDDLLPVYYFSLPGIASRGSGFKGQSSMLYYASTNRINGNLITIHTNGDKLYLNGVVIPWNGSTLAI